MEEPKKKKRCKEKIEREKPALPPVEDEIVAMFHNSVASNPVIKRTKPRDQREQS